MRTVVYTAIFGPGRDCIREPLFTDGLDFVCFTDQPMESPVWDVRRTRSTWRSLRRNARMYKMLPHHFFPEYDASIWLDGHLQLISEPAGPMLRLPDSPFIATGHGQHATIEEHAHRVRDRDDPKILDAQIDAYRAEGRVDLQVLGTGRLLRLHNDPLVQAVDEEWWQHMLQWSIRDQVSLPFVLWIDWGRVR